MSDSSAVERPAVNRGAVGSNPTRTAILVASQGSTQLGASIKSVGLPSEQIKAAPKTAVSGRGAR